MIPLYRSVGIGYQSIAAGSQNVLICGGQESMSNAPHVVALRNGTKFGDATLQDTITKDGLTDAMCNAVMGVTAENVAKRFAVTRDEQDAYAAGSQRRTAESQRSGAFDAEIVAVSVPGSRGAVTVVARDEFPRNDTTAESLAKLRPCFVRDATGTVTAGNASGINDSAAAVLLLSETEVTRRGIKPLARIVGYAQTGLEPEIMGMGAAEAIQKLVSGWQY